MNCDSKIIVFDLDETLGYFTEFGMFWDTVVEYIINNSLNITINQKLFNDLLNLYPEFIRPNIIEILNYLKNKKQNSNCKKLLIYTNNQAPKEWANYIKNYFEENINYKLFDQIIGAFQINGKRVEICRTTNSKTRADLFKCTKITENSKICFIDDSYYPEMIEENIYYINIKPYIYDLPFNEIINRFINKNIIKVHDINQFKRFLLDKMEKFNYIYNKKSKIEYNVDKALSKKILELLINFFNETNKIVIKKDTKKTKIKNLNKTKKSKRNI
jgi:hypothetical protein